MRAKGHISQSILMFTSLPLIYNSISDILPNKISTNLYNIITDNYFIPHQSDISIFYNMLIMLILTIFGSGLPDIDFQFKYLYEPYERNRMLPRYHRQITHSLILNISIFIYSIYICNPYIFFIWLGVITHLIGDMLTGSIPILLWGKYYIWPSRIGIDRFLSQSVKVDIHRAIADFFEKIWWVVIIIAIIIYIKIVI